MIKKIKKLELNLLLVGALVLPLATTISCSQEEVDEKEKTIKKINQEIKEKMIDFSVFYLQNNEYKREIFTRLPNVKLNNEKVKISINRDNIFDDKQKVVEQLHKNKTGTIDVVDRVEWEVGDLQKNKDSYIRTSFDIKSTISTPDAQRSYNTVNLDSATNQDKLLFTPNGWITGSNNLVSQNNVTSLTIPDNIYFTGNDFLSTQNVPIHYINNYAFEPKDIVGIAKIDSLVLGQNIKFIGTSAFIDNNISNLELPKNLEIVSYSAFSGNKITNLAIPSKVWFLSGFGHNQISSLEIPNSVKIIGGGAFPNNQISSLNIPDSVEIIEKYAFSNNNIKELNLPNSIIIVGYNAFQNNQLSSLTIPDSVETIDSQAFQNNKLSLLTIPDSVETIDNQAFQDNQLSSLVIPDSVEMIGDNAFLNNKFDKNSKVVLPAKFNTPEERIRIFGYDYTTKEPEANLKPKLVQKQISNLVKNINNFKKEENY